MDRCLNWYKVLVCQTELGIPVRRLIALGHTTIMAMEHRSYLYALITREHRKTGESVVKYGMTTVGLAKRMAQYPKDSLMLGACPVDDALVAVAETALLKAARQRFLPRVECGRESFEGDVDRQVALLYDIGHRFKPDLKLPIDDACDNKINATNKSSHDDGEPDEVAKVDTGATDMRHHNYRPADIVAQVHAFKTDVCDQEYEGSVVPLLHVYARYLDWLGVTNKRPICVRRLCIELRRNFGIKPVPSPHGAVITFGGVNMSSEHPPPPLPLEAPPPLPLEAPPPLPIDDWERMKAYDRLCSHVSLCTPSGTAPNEE